MLRFPILAFVFLGLTGCGIPEPDVRADWVKAVGDLGLSPIYPMREEVYIGDLWVTSEPVAKNELAFRTFGQLDARKALASWYTQRSMLPGSPANCASQPPGCPPPAGTDVTADAGKAGLSRLRIVALPSSSVTKVSADDLGLGAGASLLGRALGLDASDDEKISIALTDIEGLAVDDAAAWSLLLSACTPVTGYLAKRQGAFDASAKIMGAWQPIRKDRLQPGYLTLVTKVFYARGVNYLISDDRKFDLSAGASRGGNAPSPGAPGTAASDEAAAAGSQTPSAQGSADLEDTLNEQLDQTFDRPLAFAFDGITVRVDAPGQLCASINSVQVVPVIDRFGGTFGIRPQSQ